LSGRIEVITGPMFSGKSEELIRRLRRSKIAGKKVIAFKPSFDGRFKVERISSHNGAEFDCMPIRDTSDIFLVSEKYDVIGIDELQFFNYLLQRHIPDLRDQGKIVIINFLNTTFRAEPWPYIPWIMAIADKIDLLTAVCEVCGDEATLTQRLVNGLPANFNDDTVVVGGHEKYQARCREHFERGE